MLHFDRNPFRTLRRITWRLLLMLRQGATVNWVCDEGKHRPASLRMPMAVVNTFQNLGYLHSAAPALFWKHIFAGCVNLFKKNLLSFAGLTRLLQPCFENIFLQVPIPCLGKICWTIQFWGGCSSPVLKTYFCRKLEFVVANF